MVRLVEVEVAAKGSNLPEFVMETDVVKKL